MSDTATIATKQNPLQYLTDDLNELRAKGLAPRMVVSRHALSASSTHRATSRTPSPCSLMCSAIGWSG